MDISNRIIKRLEFNWHFTHSEGERVLSYDLESNAEVIEEGSDGWFWVKTKDNEIHKITNINSIFYDTPKDENE